MGFNTSFNNFCFCIEVKLYAPAGFNATNTATVMLASQRRNCSFSQRMKNFAWNGADSSGNQLGAGNYYVQLSGTTASGATDNSTTSYVASPVATVSKSADGKTVNLNLANGMVVDANSVTQWDS